MTPDKMLEQSELMARYARSVIAGKPIEIGVSHNGVMWSKLNSPPCWNFNTSTYREEPPKPQEFWVVRVGCSLYVYKDSATAYRFFRNTLNEDKTIIHTREVK